MCETPGTALIVTCEHAGNRVPAAYRVLFASAAARRALCGHRGYDLGALGVARGLSRRLGAPLYAYDVTRLLVDANRSPGHPALWSPFSRALSPAAREAVLAGCYRPHRTRVEAAVASALAQHPSVLHLAVHSFTPRLDGHSRRAHLGLLYDPARRREAELCARWQSALHAAAPALVVRRNYPYRGNTDGLTTSLRRAFGPRYLGVELELNQRRLANPGFGPAVVALLCATLP